LPGASRPRLRLPVAFLFVTVRRLPVLAVAMTEH
jgi:hypothetical protein